MIDVNKMREDLAHTSREYETIHSDDLLQLLERVEAAEQLVQINNQAMLEQAQRAEQAEQAVARVWEMADEMGEGKAFGILTRGREDEYPISYFIEMLEEALDGESNE